MLTSPPALLWFLDIYPSLSSEQRPLEVVQKPGDTIHVPHGWWHCVLNVSPITVALTQNRVDGDNFAATAAYFGYIRLPDEAVAIAELERQRATAGRG